jgi:hypothetical protein
LNVAADARIICDVRFLTAILTIACVLLTSNVRAGEIQLGVGYSVRKSTWRGDWAAGGQGGIGYRFARTVAIDFLGWVEPATVDRRLNTGVTVGVTGTLPFETIRPSLRLYFVHQHEEGIVSVKEQPFGALLGVGAGIRHRAGFGARLGVEIPLSKRAAQTPKKRVEWFALAAIDTNYFPDAALGPRAYFGATGGLGFNYDMPELP